MTPRNDLQPAFQLGFENARVVRFIGAGVVNTAFGYGMYALLVLAGAHAQLALAIQFGLGVIWNYSIHSRLVFGVRGYARLPAYALAYLAAYGFNAIVLAILLALGLSPLVAQLLALGPTVVLSYVLVSRALGVAAGEEDLAG
ncbi:GtrA family protein [Aliiruegeria lutimaris]|uniref:Putative flippase GtrA (Transmembrane translocase of bactoprenol-linked glucose) n=1 Tax=Aliiruegeria lutimaris TaxID=571298 RepID=A0A1G9FSX4_9RHOB|nr:GtrA family protein [Aliiruegeria lutimaris]SDK91509.1 Putative flippase GtrA (transmembrane translocase of bactoprenol-linked glucose) [Aliiruegeria lutimaris]